MGCIYFYSKFSHLSSSLLQTVHASDNNDTLILFLHCLSFPLVGNHAECQMCCCRFFPQKTMQGSSIIYNIVKVVILSGKGSLFLSTNQSANFLPKLLSSSRGSHQCPSVWQDSDQVLKAQLIFQLDSLNINS